MEFLESKAKDATFRALCPVSAAMQKRKEPLELVTRFFAYSESYLSFDHDVEQFLDDFVQKHQKAFDKRRFSQEFDRTMRFVERFFPYGFGKSRSGKTTPRVRFEALSVGVNLALKRRPDLVPSPVAEWLDSEEFVEQTTTHASNSTSRLKDRIEFVRDRLLAEEA